MTDNLNPTDNDRLTLLDRLAERIPALDLKHRSVEWIEMPDGAPGLAVDGGGFDGDGNGVTFANAPNGDVHAIGSTSALIPGTIGCVVIRPDGSRYLAQVQRDPLGATGAGVAPDQSGARPKFRFVAFRELNDRFAGPAVAE
jgi:hypothetical protein